MEMSKRFAEIIKLLELPDRNVNKFKSILNNMGISVRNHNGDIKPIEEILTEVINHKTDPIIPIVEYKFVEDENGLISDGEGNYKKEIHINFSKDNKEIHFSCDFNNKARLKTIIETLIEIYGIKTINVDYSGCGLIVYNTIVDFELKIKVNKISHGKYLFDDRNYR